MAAANGLKVYGSAGTEKGIELVKKNGAIECFNHKKKNYLQDLMVSMNIYLYFEIIFLLNRKQHKRKE